jgi:hypothetical protein
MTQGALDATNNDPAMTQRNTRKDVKQRIVLVSTASGYARASISRFSRLLPRLLDSLLRRLSQRADRGALLHGVGVAPADLGVGEEVAAADVGVNAGFVDARRYGVVLFQRAGGAQQAVGAPRGSRWALREREKRRLSIGDETLNLASAADEEVADVGCRAISQSQPDYLGRCSMEHAQPLKVFILADDHQIVVAGVLPDREIGGTRQAAVVDMGATRIQFCKRGYEPRSDIFVEEQHMPLSRAEG